jgi:hypothetical protein
MEHTNTPPRETRASNPQFTRETELSSQYNMSRKRAKERDQSTLANPPLKKGDSKRNTGTRHPDLAFLDEEEHKLMVKRRVLTDLRTLLDSLYQSYDDSKDTMLREYAKFVTNSFATYIQTKTYVESNGAVFVPVKPTSHRAPSTGVRFDLETNNQKTWADVARSSGSSVPTTSRSSLKSPQCREQTQISQTCGS